MNRLFQTIFAVGCLFALASCNSDDVTNDIDQHNVEVLSAKTSFEAAGGTNNVTVVGNVVKAYAAATWATVKAEGAKVSITAAPNHDIDSRHTTVIIKTSDQDSAIVAIDQMGAVFALNAPKSVVFNDDVNSVSYPAQGSFPFKTVTSADWITATCVDGKFTITTKANTTGHLRTGWAYVNMLTRKDSVAVKQVDVKKDLVGNYYLAMVITNPSTHKQERQYFGATLTYDADKLVLKMPALNLSIPVNYSKDDISLTLPAGNKVGTFTTTDDDGNPITFTIVMGVADKNVTATWKSPAAISGQFDYDPTLQTEVPDYKGTMLSFGKNARFILYAFTSENFDKEKPVGALLNGSDPILLKRP